MMRTTNHQTVGSVRTASTVIVYRDGNGPEIYMLKRSAKASFMPNALVFPGGALEESDHDAKWCSILGEERSCGTEGATESHLPWALALKVAALRETFEESGVLLGSVPREYRSKLENLRHRLNKGELSFLALCSEHRITLAHTMLHCIGRWMTPVVEKKRFDAYFFLAPLPTSDCALSADGVETNDGRWVSPKEALSLHALKKVQLAPPTLRALSTLAKIPLEQWDTLYRQNPTAICPQFLADKLHPTLVIPGDPEFVPAGDKINRFELVDGYWQSFGEGF